MIPLSNIDAAFWPKLIAGAADLGVSPFSLALVMNMESGIDPTAAHRDANTGQPDAVGLNQFWVSSTFRTAVPGVSVDEYLSWPASRQLERALAYWRDQLNAHPGARDGGARDLYWLNFLPATYVPNAPDDHILAPTEDGKLVAAANNNGPLVLPGETEMRNGVKVIRAAGLRNALDRAAKSGRYQAAQANLLELGASVEKLRGIAGKKIAPAAKAFAIATLGATAIVGGYVLYRAYGKHPLPLLHGLHGLGWSHG